MFEQIKQSVKASSKVVTAEKSLSPNRVYPISNVTTTSTGISFLADNHSIKVQMEPEQVAALVERAKQKQMEVVLKSLTPQVQVVIGDSKDPKLKQIAQTNQLANSSGQNTAQTSTTQTSTTQINITQTNTANTQLTRVLQPIQIDSKNVAILPTVSDNKTGKALDNLIQGNQTQAQQVQTNPAHKAQTQAIRNMVETAMRLNPNLDAAKIHAKLEQFLQNTPNSQVSSTIINKTELLKNITSIQGLPKQLYAHTQKLVALLTHAQLQPSPNYQNNIQQTQQFIRAQSLDMPQLIRTLDSLVNQSIELKNTQIPNTANNSATINKSFYTQVKAAVADSKIALHPTLRNLVEQFQLQMVKSEAQLSIFKQLQMMQSKPESPISSATKGSSIQLNALNTQQHQPSPIQQQLLRLSALQNTSSWQDFRNNLSQLNHTLFTHRQLSAALRLPNENQAQTQSLQLQQLNRMLGLEKQHALQLPQLQKLQKVVANTIIENQTRIETTLQNIKANIQTPTAANPIKLDSTKLAQLALPQQNLLTSLTNQLQKVSSSLAFVNLPSTEKAAISQQLTAELARFSIARNNNTQAAQTNGQSQLPATSYSTDISKPIKAFSQVIQQSLATNIKLDSQAVDAVKQVVSNIEKGQPLTALPSAIESAQKQIKNLQTALNTLQNKSALDGQLNQLSSIKDTLISNNLPNAAALIIKSMPQLIGQLDQTQVSNKLSAIQQQLFAGQTSNSITNQLNQISTELAKFSDHAIPKNLLHKIQSLNITQSISHLSVQQIKQLPDSFYLGTRLLDNTNGPINIKENSEFTTETKQDWLTQHQHLTGQVSRLTHASLIDIDSLLTRLIIRFVAKGQLQNNSQLSSQLNKLFSTQVNVDGVTTEFSKLLGQKDVNVQSQIQQVLSQLESSNKQLKQFLNRYLPNFQGKGQLETLLRFEKEIETIQQSLKRNHENHLQQQLSQTANQQHLVLPLHFGEKLGEVIFDIFKEQDDTKNSQENKEKSWQVNLHFDFEHIQRFMMKLKMTENKTARVQIIVPTNELKHRVHQLQTIFLSRLSSMNVEVEQFHIHVNQQAVEETFRTMNELRATA